MESTPAMPGHAPHWVRVVQVVVAVVVLAFCVSTVPGVRPAPGFNSWLDGWLQGTCYVLVAAVIVLRAVLTTTHTRLWRLLAAAVATRALGFVVELAYVSRLAHPPYPSVADGLWVLSSLILLLVLIGRVRQFAPRQSLLVALDALTGALAAAAFAVFALHHAISALTTSSTTRAAVVVNIVYPALDVALLVAAATAVATAWTRLAPTDVVVIVGIVGFAVVDVVYLVRLADGTWHPGSTISALSLLATLVIAYSAWIPSGRVVPPGPDAAHQPSVVPTAVFGLACVGVFVLDDFVETPKPTVVLTGIALVVAITRGVITLAEDRTYSGRIIGATSEELLRFQALVESSNDFIAIARPDATILYLNPGGRRLLSMSADAEVASMTIPTSCSRPTASSGRACATPRSCVTGSGRGAARWSTRAGVRTSRSRPRPS